MLNIALDAVMQSYGSEVGYTASRRTWAYPSKSAVMGMIAKAGAFYRDDKQISAIDKAVTMTVYVMRVGQKITDFQTIGDSRNADGKIRGETMLSEREYLTDARFVVGLQGDMDALHSIRNHINNPRSVIYLGRACCIPSVPLVAEFIDLEPKGWQSKVVECLPGDAGALMVRDRPLVASARSFLPRWIRVIKSA